MNLGLSGYDSSFRIYRDKENNIFEKISKTKLVLHEFVKAMSVYYIFWSLIVCVGQNWYKYHLGLCVKQLETISVFQQTQINITFFANHSTVAFVTVCYWPMNYSVVTYIMTRNGNSCFFPPLFATSLFLFVDQPLELLAKVLLAFIRLSANSHEKSRSVFSSLCRILGWNLYLFYNIQSFTFVMPRRFQKILIYPFLVFADIRYNAISISAKTIHPVLLL